MNVAVDDGELHWPDIDKDFLSKVCYVTTVGSTFAQNIDSARLRSR